MCKEVLFQYLQGFYGLIQSWIYPPVLRRLFFTSLSKKNVILIVALFIQDLRGNSFEKLDYSLHPTSFNKVFVDVCASVMALVLSPERVSLLTESVSLLR